MKHARCAALLASAGALLIGYVFTGCEAEPANSGIEIYPASVTLATGEAQEFQVSGGYDYEWSLKDESLGTLNTRTGPRVIYTNRGAGSNTVQEITVTSWIEGTGGGTSNASAYAQSATAVVYSSGEEGVPVPPTPVAVTIRPTSVALVPGDDQPFTASGGDGVNYSWYRSAPTLGSLSAETGSSVTYTHNPGTLTNMTQTLTVYSGGYSASASVTTLVVP
jgi:hypothetical protein